MREILFRGKTFDNKNWIEGSFIVGRDLDSGDLIYLISPLSAYYTEIKKVIPESVSEFTGLTDKNGTKIFEGDIVKWGITFVIAWQDCKFVLKKDINSKMYHYVLSCFDGSELKVIGNIHDNPELLKGE